MIKGFIISIAYLSLAGVEPERAEEGVKYHSAGFDIYRRLSLSNSAKVPRSVNQSPERRHW